MRICCTSGLPTELVVRFKHPVASDGNSWLVMTAFVCMCPCVNTSEWKYITSVTGECERGVHKCLYVFLIVFVPNALRVLVLQMSATSATECMCVPGKNIFVRVWGFSLTDDLTAVCTGSWEYAEGGRDASER